MNIDDMVPALAAPTHARSRWKIGLVQRYFVPRKFCRTEIDIFSHDLSVSEDGSHWINNCEFKRKYRMSREMLHLITEEIKDHDVFKNSKRGPHQMPVKHQLMILLHFLGLQSQTNHAQRNMFHISEGACELY